MDSFIVHRIVAHNTIRIWRGLTNEIAWGEDIKDDDEIRCVLPVIRVTGVVHRYQVRWRGYKEEDDTYEPYANVVQCRAFTEYLRHKPKRLYGERKRGNSGSGTDDPPTAKQSKSDNTPKRKGGMWQSDDEEEEEGVDQVVSKTPVNPPKHIRMLHSTHDYCGAARSSSTCTSSSSIASMSPTPPHRAVVRDKPNAVRDVPNPQPDAFLPSNILYPPLPKIAKKSTKHSSISTTTPNELKSATLPSVVPPPSPTHIASSSASRVAIAKTVSSSTKTTDTATQCKRGRKKTTDAETQATPGIAVDTGTQTTPMIDTLEVMQVKAMIDAIVGWPCVACN